jgi:hypothetical protein
MISIQLEDNLLQLRFLFSLLGWGFSVKLNLGLGLACNTTSTLRLE